MSADAPGKVRAHSDGVEATDLRTYRNRHAQYRTDPDLQALHAAAPCLVTWDDHEVQNDYADDWSQNFDDPSAFWRAARRRITPSGSTCRCRSRRCRAGRT